jgi:hypothetical protein
LPKYKNKPSEDINPLLGSHGDDSMLINPKTVAAESDEKITDKASKYEFNIYTGLISLGFLL